MSETEEKVTMEVSLEEEKAISPEPVPTNEDDDVLDQVFEGAERVCCGHGEKKVAPIVSEDKQPPDLEEGQSKEPLAESPDDNFALETESEVEDDYAAPQKMERDTSKVKEAVEIQAHFDGDEDELTITSEIGQDVSTLGASLLVEGKDNKYRQRRIGCAICILLVLLALLALVIGLVVDKDDSSELTAESGLTNNADVVSPTEAPFESITADEDTPNTENNGGATGLPEEETAPPTEVSEEAENASPTATPTEFATTCQDSIQVSQGCYQYFQDEIMTTFNICEPVSLDWIGLYPEGSDPAGLDFPQFEWNYSCGDRTCEGAVTSDTVNMNRFMPPGRYQAFLFSNRDGDNGAPYPSIASSNVFEISATGCE